MGNICRSQARSLRFETLAESFNYREAAIASKRRAASRRQRPAHNFRATPGPADNRAGIISHRQARRPCHLGDLCGAHHGLLLPLGLFIPAASRRVWPIMTGGPGSEIYGALFYKLACGPSSIIALDAAARCPYHLISPAGGRIRREMGRGRPIRPR